ncbi:hypothetical protein Poly51_03790 [Rubripirellula tenax]|uniref:Type II secretion system protein G n=1 Tax=Rubripirellula tenax TaxID=2528015 RepID=A0A5C6FGW9_9BACT|nr:prepilin-type N-terminal cleavage/methylation domain-containing protein [Rubripirellula tenax]TWU60105.1 hypothetical protein Poly51_03790 [Rubripirellula tenax]
MSNHIHHPRSAFTLVELMVVIVLLGILSGMTGMMLTGAKADAKEKKAKRQIETIEQILLSELNEMSFAPVALVRAPSTTNTARTLMIGNRDRFRMAFPDRRGDLLMPPARLMVGVSGAASPSKIRPPNLWFRMRSRLSLDGTVTLPPFATAAMSLENIYGIGTGPTWTGGFTFTPPMLTRRAFADSTSSIIPTPANDNTPVDVENYWTRQHESAECLYLILSVIEFNGTPALELMGNDMVGNTDGDLVPEIIDPWGKPLLFIRWPVGHVSQTSTEADPFDFTQVDPRFSNPVVSNRPFRTTMLIASGGPDEEFGLYSSPASFDDTTTTDFAYADVQDPTDANYRYPDPYHNLGGDAVASNDNYFIDDPSGGSRYNASRSTPQGGGFGSILTGKLEETKDNITNLKAR